MSTFRNDGSQISWLIYADWLEDQGLPANHIRELANEYDHKPNLDVYECSLRYSAPEFRGMYSLLEGFVGGTGFQEDDLQSCYDFVGYEEWGHDVGSFNESVGFGFSFTAHVGCM